MSNGRAPLAASLHASGAETSSSEAASVDLWAGDPLLPRTHLELDLDVSAIDGTLTVVVETSRDNDIWTTLGQFTATTAVGTVHKVLPGAKRYVRARWTLTGTSATFALTGQGLLVYATPEDLDIHGLPAKATVDVSLEVKAGVIRAACAMVDGRLPATMSLPLSSWDDDLRAIVCDIANWRILRRRGFNPESAVDSTIRQAYEDAVAQLRDVQTEKADLSGATVDATPDVAEHGAHVVVPRRRRGWRDLVE